MRLAVFLENLLFLKMRKIKDQSIDNQFGVPATIWNRLVEEFKSYRVHQNEYLDKYEGKYLVLHDLQVAGAFQTYDEAYDFASKRLESDTFLIQKCTAGDKEFTVTLPPRFFA